MVVSRSYMGPTVRLGLINLRAAWGVSIFLVDPPWCTSPSVKSAAAYMILLCIALALRRAKFMSQWNSDPSAVFHLSQCERNFGSNDLEPIYPTKKSGPINWHKPAKMGVAIAVAVNNGRQNHRNWTNESRLIKGSSSPYSLPFDSLHICSEWEDHTRFEMFGIWLWAGLFSLFPFPIDNSSHSKGHHAKTAAFPTKSAPVSCHPASQRMAKLATAAEESANVRQRRRRSSHRLPADKLTNKWSTYFIN